DFTSTDLLPNRDVVIVNQSFVNRMLGGRNAIGRRIRFAASRGSAPQPWSEIVGVVPDLTMNAFEHGNEAGVYQPFRPNACPVQLAVPIHGDAAAFTPRLRTIAARLDPTLRLTKAQTLEASANALAKGGSFFAYVLVGIAAIAMLLAAVGLYALMSFTVSRR